MKINSIIVVFVKKSMLLTHDCYSIYIFENFVQIRCANFEIWFKGMASEQKITRFINVLIFAENKVFTMRCYMMTEVGIRLSWVDEVS